MLRTERQGVNNFSAVDFNGQPIMVEFKDPKSDIIIEINGYTSNAGKYPPRSINLSDTRRTNDTS